MKSVKRKMLYTFCINLFFAFTILIFGPMEIFISNSSDFQFSIFDFWWMPVTFSIGYLIVSTFLITILPDKLNEVVIGMIFAFTLCCYIQTMFLNGSMKVLTGQEIAWSGTTIFVNLLIWGGVAAAVFLVRYYLKDKGRPALQFFSLAVTAIQLFALISLLFTTDVMQEEKNGYLSTEGMLELSQEENVIVFILDFFDGRTMDAILEKRQDILSPLDGFTYYPNATSVHSRTYPSIAYLLTGNMCYFDEEPSKYINTAFSDSDFIPTLCENQIETGLYTFPYYIGNSAKPQICNYVSEKQKLRYWEVIRVCGKMTLYRDMPYLVKKRFEYDVSNINNRVVRNNPFYVSEGNGSIVPYQHFDDEWFYDTLMENELHANEAKGCFRFYHLAGCHENLSNPVPNAIRSLEIVYAYLEKMREIGVYDASTIIITTDHGSSGSGDTLDLPQQTAVPIVIVKPAGKSGEAVKISDAPVSHTDFIPTVLDGFSLNEPENGRPFYDIAQGERRERFYYYTALYSEEEGEVELREYSVDGDAREKDSYHFTGKKWDVMYSYNIVSQK